MKSLVIGAFTDYDWEILAPWVKSLNECGFQGDKAVIVFNATYQTVTKLIEHGIKPIVFNRDNEKKVVTYASANRVHIERFFIVYRYLEQLGKDYDYVVTTDMRDVIFQTDPIAWLRENLGDKKLVAGGEALRYRDEEWNIQNLYETFGPTAAALFQDNEIFNVGTLGGTSEAMKDLMLNLFTSSVNRRIPIVDQAVFNVLIQSEPFKQLVKFAPIASGWACQAGTTADPTKIEKFRPNLLDKEPVFDNGIVKTAEGKIFSIVHQYDRVPAWKEFFTTKFADAELKEAS